MIFEPYIEHKKQWHYAGAIISNTLDIERLSLNVEKAFLTAHDQTSIEMGILTLYLQKPTQ